MPGEFEEFRLQVTLQDDATPKLREIQRVVGDFGGGSYAANMERFKRQTNEINESIRALTETLTKGPAALEGFARPTIGHAAAAPPSSVMNSRPPHAEHRASSRLGAGWSTARSTCRREAGKSLGQT
jgi:hypothetical protein